MCIRFLFWDQKYGAEKMSKKPHFGALWCEFIPWYRLFLSGLCIFFPWGVTGRSEAHKCSLPVYYSCKWVVKTQKCHLVSGRGGKQEPKLRSSTYHSTHFCHMKSKLSILGISETYLGTLDPSKSGYRKHLFSCTGVFLSSWCRFYFKSLFSVQDRKWNCQAITDRHKNDLLQTQPHTALNCAQCALCFSECNQGLFIHQG